MERKLPSLVMIFMLSFVSCTRDSEPERAPDPLADASGVYIGSVQDRNTIIPNVKANVTTALGGAGLYISSVGLTASNYQLVLGSDLNGERNGAKYRLNAHVDGSALNISGNITSPSLVDHIYGQFSFTGTKSK